MTVLKCRRTCWQTAVWLLIAVLMIILFATNLPAKADGIPTIEYMPSYARTGDNDTPFVIYLTVSELNENTSYEFTARINHAGTDRGSFTTADIGNFGISYLSLGTTPDGCGTNCSLSKWVFLRATATVPAEPSNIRIRTRVVGASTPPFDDLSGPDFLNMTTAGGWLEESTGVARDGRAVAVFDNTDLIGLYVAKLNGVNDGYPNDSGYYRVAVPDCTDCGYTVETWELDDPGVAVGQINTMGENGCPDDVGIGAVQSMNSCNTPTAVSLAAIGVGSAVSPIPPLLLLLVVVGTAVGLILVRRRRPA
jgi:hypothetical protein